MSRLILDVLLTALMAAVMGAPILHKEIEVTHNGVVHKFELDIEEEHPKGMLHDMVEQLKGHHHLGPELHEHHAQYDKEQFDTELLNQEEQNKYKLQAELNDLYQNERHPEHLIGHQEEHHHVKHHTERGEPHLTGLHQLAPPIGSQHHREDTVRLPLEHQAGHIFEEEEHHGMRQGEKHLTGLLQGEHHMGYLGERQVVRHGGDRQYENRIEGEHNLAGLHPGMQHVKHEGSRISHQTGHQMLGEGRDIGLHTEQEGGYQLADLGHQVDPKPIHHILGFIRQRLGHDLTEHEIEENRHHIPARLTGYHKLEGVQTELRHENYHSHTH